MAGLGVYSLAIFDDGMGGGPALYAGGEFNSADGAPAFRVARWSGSAWSPVGGGTNGGVYSFTSFDDGAGGGSALYAGGFFQSAGGVPANGIAKWDGAAWAPLGDGVDGGVFALLPFDDGAGVGPALYAGGSFQAAGQIPAHSIARWQGCATDSCATADINCDGTVNGADLGLLLAGWGACPGCPADLNGDGVVDGSDLGILLGAWTG